jgi:glyoxylase-like metal-dependent hydrolase (beta-lactamase superfamily II)
VEEIRKETGAAVYLHPDERAVLGRALEGEHPVKEGVGLPLGRFRISPLSTPGHTPGGMTYVAGDEERRVAFTGDALFAGSVGRSRSSQSYPLLLEGIREKILVLPDEIPLFPGHGPATSVGEEKRHNPFFP